MNPEQIASYAAVLTAIADGYRARRHTRQQATSTLLAALTHQALTRRAHNQSASAALNVFRFFNPGETTHSRLLAFFLDPRAAHGQGMLFLTEFLRLLGIADPAGPAHQWQVTAEVGRIDVLLKRAHPLTVIVLENKSNYARDQPQQLYRYWYHQIYLPQLAQHCPASELAHPPRERYRLLYLTPAAWKQVHPHSLCRPAEWASWGDHLPATVPLSVEPHLFSDLIEQWLTSALAQLPPTNHRLREFTLQYIQFWQAS